METLKGYKAFDADFKCRGMQYEVGKTYEVDGEIRLCGNGLHFCINAQDTLNYYSTFGKFAEVESVGKWITNGDKSVTNKLKIVREISHEEFLRLVNSGHRNSGHRNSGNWNSGYQNSGNRNSGDWNSGNWNSGNWNSGYQNSGNLNSGNWNSGYQNSGYQNSGNLNSGNLNSGHRNSGHQNSGNLNSGNQNSGDHNSGDHNSGDRNSGMFNSNTAKVRMFNKQTRLTFDDVNTHPFVSLINIAWYDLFSVWVDTYKMTEQEKIDYPSHVTTGGYLRTANYKECWSMMWDNFTDEQRALVKTLPNYNAKVFEEITGIKYK